MKKLIILLILIISVKFYAQEELDKVIAVVDDELILNSELQIQATIYAARQRLDPKDPNIQMQVLNSMIEEKLLYAQAGLDSITVSESQVDQQLDYQINYFVQQYGSKEKVEEAYNMPIEKIKRQLRDDVRKNLMAETVKNQKFGTVESTRREVKEFFEEYEDSLGLIPEKFEIAHIFVNPKTTSDVKRKAYNLAKTLLDSIKNGADFAELAKKFSDDPGSKKFGGDLGFVKRGVFYPEFESVAFSMLDGELSDVVESPVGYHIIQLIERRGETIHTRHILIKIKPDDDADLKAIETLTEIRDSITRKFNTFEYYAKLYSDDKETKNFGGVLGKFERSQLDKKLLEVVEKLKIGELSFPNRLDVNPSVYGYHIVKLINRVPEHRPDFDKDYLEIKKLADFRKKQLMYNEWMTEIKGNIYWEIKE